MVDIRILIVDDSTDKLNRYLPIFHDAGIVREQIDVALHGMDARDKLRSSHYDLMVLDLALPLRPEDPPNQKGGVDLLKEIDERPGFNRPSHIVGVTAFENLTTSFEHEFANRMLFLLHFDPAAERWQSQLKTLLNDLTRVRERQDPVGYGKDVCILTALQDPELRAVRDLPFNFGQPRLLDDVTYYFEGALEVQGISFSVIASAPLRMGLVPSAIRAMKLLHYFRPKLLVMTGICAGISGKVGLGDVILANPAWEWQSGKRIIDNGEARFLSDPHQLDVNPAVVARYAQFIDTSGIWSEIASNWRGPKPNTALRGVIGPLASGSVVAADGTTIRNIQATQHRKLIGLEMEIYGVYAAAQEFPTAPPLTFALKGVSDLADIDKVDDYQGYAAYTSANALYFFLKEYLPQLVSIGQGHLNSIAK